MKFEANTFIVTGGASGLGEATVRALHGAGANVVIADLNVEQGERLAAELGARTAFNRTNVADEADAKAAVELALTRFGGLQGLVNCAGIGNAAKVLGKEGPQPLAEFIKRQGAIVVLIFVLIHKIGDTLANLTVRLLFQDLGFTNDEIAFYDVGVGFVTLLVGVFVGGIGLALATPLTVVVMVLVRSLYVRDLLGDRSEGGRDGA